MIDRDAIEAKARQLEEALTETGASLRSKTTVNALRAAAMLLIAFLAGRKRGRRKSARIEIHRL